MVVVEFHPVLLAAVVVNHQGIGWTQSRALRTANHPHVRFFNSPRESYQSDFVAKEVKNVSPNVRLGEASKGRLPLGVVAVVGLNQNKTSHWEEIVAL